MTLSDRTAAGPPQPTLSDRPTLSDLNDADPPRRKPLTFHDVVDQARNDRQRSYIQIEREAAHAVVTLDDPDKLNPLSAELTVQLHDELVALAADPSIRAIVLTGRDPAFSAGGDLRLMVDVAQRQLSEPGGGATEIWRWIRHQFGGIARLITRTDKAFIAAVNGPAAGVGLAFALACDVLLLSEKAQIVPAFGKIGLVPEVGNSWLLTRRLGYQRTFGLFASGRHLSGSEAFEMGLGNEVVAHEQLLPTAIRWCERIEQLPEHVLEMSKPLLRNCADLSWEQAIAMEEFAEPMCFTTERHKEGVSHLLDRGA
jgi:2-(1,2-epoxy-1,2-dihydrophenyl)acetyl-CoA isomerase